MIEIKNVSGTAFIIAQYRADGSKDTTPLYHDEIVKLFLTNETKKIAEDAAKNFPAAKEMVKIRTKYFDDTLSKEILQGCKQVVILGSGLDTRPARKNTPGVKYFEIENETTLKFKEEILNANGIAADVSYIPGDYIKDNLIALLDRHHFNFNLSTYFIWEGNSSYLTEAEINIVLKQLRENVVEFKISFDYMSDQVITRTTGYSDMDDYMNKLEQMGAIWKSGFANIEQLANQVNLKVVDNFSTAELQQEYFPHPSLKSNIFRFYFLCTLEKYCESKST
ncbi:MAG TPA: SAM-dependent methyltransferase [Kamptonema sp.]|nr:SAM-dependent methyltransferase [Kamptonema sp.]